jgi:hypothetical protein
MELVLQKGQGGRDKQTKLFGWVCVKFVQPSLGLIVLPETFFVFNLTVELIFVFTDFLFDDEFFELVVEVGEHGLIKMLLMEQLNQDQHDLLHFGLGHLELLQILGRQEQR